MILKVSGYRLQVMILEAIDVCLESQVVLFAIGIIAWAMHTRLGAARPRLPLSLWQIFALLCIRLALLVGSLAMFCSLGLISMRPFNSTTSEGCPA